MCVSARACVWRCHACTALAANPSVPWSVQADYLEHVAKDIESAHQRYARACTLAPDNADILGAFAAFLAHTRKDLELAEEYYCRAIELDRRHAENLGGYAVLLMTLYRRGGDVAGLVQRAHDCFRLACEAAPDNPAHVGNYAVFLANVACEMGEAAQLFQTVLAADPSNVTMLLNYAHFLEMCVEKDAAAEEVFQRALAASGRRDARVLGSYAVFRARVQEDSLDENTRLFEEAIEADPRHAPNLAAYAQYSSRVLAQHDDADRLFRKAIQHAPSDAGTHSSPFLLHSPARWPNVDVCVCMGFVYVYVSVSVCVYAYAYAYAHAHICMHARMYI